MNEPRKSNGTSEQRRPWYQRNAGLVALLGAWFLATAGAGITVWANSNTALALAQENKKVNKEQQAQVAAVPHLDEKLDNHVESFKDFRNEQRKFNESIIKKLDYVVMKVGD